ncbi:cellobiose dehydrogenase [Chlorociboria aeruginascens]|nr:cellobiose dehydrogenase [Chlorociboria aeruginascens]
MLVQANQTAIRGVSAQDFVDHHGTYTDPTTGIVFYTSVEVDGTFSGDGEFTTTTVGGYTFGLALPENALTVDSYEYIGLIIGSIPNGTGWAGVVHGTQVSAGMPNHLMLIAWPNAGEIMTSFRYTTSYDAPVLYEGTATVSEIYSDINSTHWTFIYRCGNCYIFDDPSQTAFNMSTSLGSFEQGWSQNIGAPDDAGDPFNAVIAQHNNGMGEFQIEVASATQASYSVWATQTVTSTGPTGSATATSSYSSIPVPTATTWDYVVVGAGAGGIPVADKLAQSGKSVLLVEKGVASSARWGGRFGMVAQMVWLSFAILFSINGYLANSGRNANVSFIPEMAGCILGGGTAINAGLWWNPNPEDWDYLFPTGWKSTDMAAATSRVFSLIPGTDHPSMDGKLYLQTGYDVVSQGLKNAGWANVTANSVPGQKNRTYSRTPYMYINGERGGPMATYLVDAAKRSNFQLWLNTSVERIVRTGGHATALQVIATDNGGHAGTINLTPVTGRVIVTAGAFGTPKLLFRSGIGPTDQLQVVQTSADGPTMINQTYWIDLPVGYNLDDHMNTDVLISHPSVVYYDWVGAWDTPNPKDASNYLTKRIGPLAQAAPDIAPMFWEEITGVDGIVRQIQWTARVEGATNQSMTLSSYLGRGQTSRGRTTISKGLSMSVTTLPYGDPDDLEAVGRAIDHVVAAMNTITNMNISGPPPGMTGAEYLASIPLTYANVGARRANHWLGTAKIGNDSALAGGTSVVDLNTKVYGTDNIFVTDASIFPGMPSTNPSALIVVAAEAAAARILALPANTAIARYGQCGGLNYAGSQACAAPFVCTYGNAYYSQCL